jgi:protein associated with RNAse G/E
MWNPGDVIVWRAIFRNRIWNALAVIIVKDTPEEIILTLLPEAECMTETDYAKGKKNGKRRWDFKDEFWKLEKYSWRTNRLLFLLAPEKYYSIIYFWNGTTNEFRCYYINFQLPFRRSPLGIDTLDLELDLVIDPNFLYRWKDLDEYEQAIEAGIILPGWVDEIETAKLEVLDRLAKRQYPFDGSWLSWKPDPNWLPPKLAENWDKI